jgi:hypothetical protein
VRNKFNHASEIKKNQTKSPTAKDMVILSLGTGDVKKDIPIKKLKTGVILVG